MLRSCRIVTFFAELEYLVVANLHKGYLLTSPGSYTPMLEDKSIMLSEVGGHS